MKRVVQNKKEETIDLDSVNWNNPHIGVARENRKYFLQERTYSPVVETLRADLRNGTHIVPEGDGFKDAVKIHLNHPSHKVYVFDSHKELFLWLAE